MKKNRFFFTLLTMCMLCPLAVRAESSFAQLERAVLKALMEQQPKYYVPLIQINEQDAAPTTDGEETGLFEVEIGYTQTENGYMPEFFSLLAEVEVKDEKDGPCGIFYEEIVPSIFNEAYRRFASNPRSAKATMEQTRELLTLYYRQVQAEERAKADKASK